MFDFLENCLTLVFNVPALCDCCELRNCLFSVKDTISCERKTSSLHKIRTSAKRVLNKGVSFYFLAKLIIPHKFFLRSVFFSEIKVHFGNFVHFNQVSEVLFLIGNKVPFWKFCAFYSSFGSFVSYR